MLIDLVITLPFVLWLLLRFALPAGPYEMDHGNGAKPGTFFPLMLVYHVFFYVLAGISLFIAMELWKHNVGALSIVPMLGAIYALLFNGFTVFFYESYMHKRYLGSVQILGTPVPRTGASNYTLARYAIVISMGVSAAACFIWGVLLLAAMVVE